MSTEAATSSHGDHPALSGPRHFSWRWIGLAVAIALAITALFIFTGLEWRDVQRAVLQLNTPTTLVLMAVLPLAGFSIGLVHLMAGAKFGFVMGGLIITGVHAFHLLASYAIARSVLRGPIERRLQKRLHRLPRIPKDDDVAATLLAVLVPGVPYVLRNYFIPLAGVPLHIYFWICLPIYVAHSYMAFFLVALAADPGGRRLVTLAVIYVLKLAICAEVIRRIRKRHRHKNAPGWP